MGRRAGRRADPLMNERILRLDPAERQFLAFTLSADEVWPPNESLTVLLQQVPGGDVAGGPQLRALVLALATSGGDDAGELPIALSPSEIWLLDSLLLRRDLRREKLADGRPLSDFAHKVWELILDLYEDRLPQDLRKEATRARDEDPDQDASEIVASAEALLRSRNREGAEGDLPSAAA